MRDEVVVITGAILSLDRETADIFAAGTAGLALAHHTLPHVRDAVVNGASTASPHGAVTPAPSGVGADVRDHVREQ